MRQQNKKTPWDVVRDRKPGNQDSDQLYWAIAQRTFGVYSRTEQNRIKNATVAIVGVGCDGGMSAYILARMGIGELILIDFDVNELSNLNRQPMATYSTIGIPKVYAGKTIIKDLNPTVNVEAINEPLDEDNAKRHLQEADVVIQCTDSITARIITVRACQQLNTPCVIMTGQPPFRGFASTIMPDGPNYEDLFGLDFVKGKKFKNNPRLEEQVRALKKERARHASKQAAAGWLTRYLIGTAGWSITPERSYTTAVYQTHEALAVITGRKPKAIAPKAYISDLNGLLEFGRPDCIVAILKPTNEVSWDYRLF